MLLSRTPILSSRNHLLPKYASLGPMSVQRSALEGVIETGRGSLRVYSVHLTHLSAATRMPQLERLLEIHRQAPVEGAAIGGDQTSIYVVMSRTYQRGQLQGWRDLTPEVRKLGPGDTLRVERRL